MDAIWIYLLLAFVVIVPIVWRIVRRRVLSRAAQLGTTAGVNLEERVKSSNLKGAERDAAILGTRIQFPNARDGHAVVADALGSSKSAAAGADSTWSISHGSPDMVIAAWQENADGSGTFLALRAKEALGALIQTRTWSKILDQIQLTATQRGVDSTTTIVPLVKSSEVVDGDAIWILAT